MEPHSLFHLLANGKALESEANLEVWESHKITGNEEFSIVTNGACNHGYDFERVLTPELIENWLSQSSCSCLPSEEEETITFSIRPMHIAVKIKHHALIEYLLEKGAAIDPPTGSFSLTPLYNCVLEEEEAAEVDMVRYLLKKGADPLHAVFTENSSTLHACAKMGHNRLLKSLLEHGADKGINQVTDIRKYTPLFQAVWRHNFPCVKTLVEHGADVNIPDQRGLTPLFCAIREGERAMADLLLEQEHCDVNARPLHNAFRDMSPLHMAIQHRDKELVQRLLEKGALVNELAESDISPLMLTVYIHCPSIARLLLEHHASPDLTNYHLYSPLHSAAWDGLMPIVQDLLAAGAKHDERTQDGNTPLSLACHGNQWPVVQLLLPLGCRVNNVDKDDDMPLHYSSYNGCLETTVALLEHGARPDCPNRLGTTPLWNAAYRGHGPIVRLLLRHNPDAAVTTVGIQQEAQTSGVSECFEEPRSALYAACHAGAAASAAHLLAAGLRLDRERWLYEEEQLAGMSEEVRKLLVSALNQPPTLLNICRRLIRDLLRVGEGSLSQQLLSLDVPQTLRDYLLTVFL